MKDKEIISRIKKGDTEAAVKVLYKEFPKIRANILSHGGDEDIAQEIFHDSLILLIEKVNERDFKLTSKLSTYLYGINRFMWMNEARKRQKNPEAEWKDTLILTADDLGYDNEKEEELKQLEIILSSVSARCKEIFELFYFKKESMKRIAEILDFSSVNSAKTQKYKCMEKAILMAKELKQPTTTT
ncbi:RNA polymerase sigma factor [Crocinitomix algicola]|uniref:RNA polymerase sigma factor n=1 Tax=Crocinitomix algicola TaxID=1740263 RepID=UPI00082A0B25|nr:sigma-70 family RNA polymerase sigma factor [Crocinitomix algicola]